MFEGCRWQKRRMALPFLGLGLSSNAQVGDVPNPYRLLDEVPGAFDFVEYSAPLDFEQATREASLLPEMLERRASTPLLYHPVHVNLWGPKLESAQRLSLLDAHLRAVGSPWVSNDVGWWHTEGSVMPGYLYLSPPLDAKGLENAVAHALAVRDGVSVPMLLENPVVMTARGPWHVLDFMERLSTSTGCDLLLDVGHLFSHQLARGLAVTEGLDSFPFERVVEVHLAGGVVTSRGPRQVYVDDHPQPIRDEVWALLEWVLPRCTRLRALTYEGDGHPAAVAKLNLRRLRALLPTANTEVVSRAAVSSSVAAGLETAWQLFDDVHRAKCDEDPVGAIAELDYRLAVMVQTLDAAVPLTRVAVAATREAMARFAASDALREWFANGTREFTEVFVAWALREARLMPGAEALVSLEAWAQQTARRLANGTAMNATFPVCLSEALHASRALQRHLGARAWWSNAGLEWSGLDGLWQAARRSSPGPWLVTLRRNGARIEITEART